MFAEIVQFIVESVSVLGYPGIFFLMLLESSFFPFPSEVVMVPAGYLASKGEMHLGAVIASGIGGSLAGALLNYYLALWVGRKFLLKYGKYMLIHERTIFKMEQFFERHGHISTFSGRLLPGVRQYISLPAGIARMDLKQFMFFTTLGAGLWVVILTLLGYYLGENEALVKAYMAQIVIGLIVSLVIVAAVYILIKQRRRNR
jgi:membrane protein DedA with SNARE-associated domain